MNFSELKEKALSLPLSPGVYIMRDKAGAVIYVGKAKKLKNRVSQYFQDTASHTLKTKKMVSRISDFDVIVASSEFEALVLECAQIKRYSPKYNILLKDDKGYPYVRLDMTESYPTIEMVSKIKDDGAEYFGPFGSRSVTANLIETVLKSFSLPTCGKKFPREFGKDRPCLNFHMDQCVGWCQGNQPRESYMEAIRSIRKLLNGKYRVVADSLRKQMLSASDQLDFEKAAHLRDQLNAVESLGKKQLVTAGRFSDLDVIGYEQNAAKACFAVLHYKSGDLVDKEYEVISAQENMSAALSSLVKQYYLNRNFAPRTVLLPFDMDDRILFERMLTEKFGRKTEFVIPVRGDRKHMVDIAQSNAFQEAQRVTNDEDRVNKTLILLGKMLNLESVRQIEAYDISNISGTDIVGGMVVFQDGKPKKSQYKRFKIDLPDGQDDYAAMEQMLTRRFRHYIDGDSSFSDRPDLLLIDGGITHAGTAVRVLTALDLSIPVFGMVKDDHHRTRALVTDDGKEIHIDAVQPVFSLIGNIQEETHNYAIGYHRKLRSKRLQYSQLDAIPGIGSKRKQQLLNTFKSLSAIRDATVQDLQQILPTDAARAVYLHFHPDETGEGTQCE